MRSHVLFCAILIGISACDDARDQTPSEAEMAVSAVLAHPADASIDTLRSQSHDRCVLTRRVEALIAADSVAPVALLLQHALRGDSLSQLPRERFGRNASGGSTPDQEGNARRLGYVSGVVQAAFKNRSTWVRRQLGTDAGALAALTSALAPDEALMLRARPFRDIPIGLSNQPGEVRAHVSFDGALGVLDAHTRPLDEQGDRYGSAIQRYFEASRQEVMSSCS